MPEVWGTTQVLGVIGWPVRHSFSPPMQNAALAELGLDMVYVPFAVQPEALPAAVAGFRAAGVVGINATIPHKQPLVGLVDELTDEARLTGTVNTLHFLEDKLVGDSTDGPGFIAGLAAAGGAVAGKQIVLLGAGGSGRAVSVSLARSGAAEVAIANRTVERSEALARHLNEHVRAESARVVAWDTRELQQALAGADVIVNTTSVGMHPNHAEQPVELPELRPGAWVVDIIYNPLRTRLLEEAERRGARVLGGVDMLVQQGALSLARWTGRQPPVARMREVLLAELRKRAR